MKLIITYLFFLLISSCCYPLSTVPSNKEHKVVLVDSYKDSLHEKVKYSIGPEIIPPDQSKTALGKGDLKSILPDDIWDEVYNFKGLHLIYSKSYNDRQCRYEDEKYSAFLGGNPRGGFVNLFGSCLPRYDYALVIDDNGSIKGWHGLNYYTDTENSCKRKYIILDEYEVDKWPDVRFKEINSSISK